MNIEEFFNKICIDIESDKDHRTRMRVKTILEYLGVSKRSEKNVSDFNKHAKENSIVCNPEFSLNLDYNEFITFQYSETAIFNQPIKETSKPKPMANTEYSLEKKIKPENIQVPPDFFLFLFDFVTDSIHKDHEAFQAILDSYQPAALFLIPEDEDFFSEVINKVLYYEILRKKQYSKNIDSFNKKSSLEMEIVNAVKSDESVAAEINNVSGSDVWNISDIYQFSESKMKNVIIGHNGNELLESEEFDKQFSQLSLIVNKYNSNPFFIIFHCPSLELISKHDRFDVLENLIEKVKTKIPNVFRLECRFPNEKKIPSNYKEKIIDHFKILHEVPTYSKYNINDKLIDTFLDLQRIQTISENTLLNKFQGNIFDKVIIGAESDEHVYLKYFAINTLLKKGYSLSQIQCEAREYKKDPDDNEEHVSRPDIKVEGKIIVEIETLRQKSQDKNVYMSLIYSFRKKSKAWDNYSELWLVVPGFEISRNYTQLSKIENLLFKPSQKIKVRFFIPDYENLTIVEVNFEEVNSHPSENKRATEYTKKIIKNSKSLTFQDVKGLKEEKQYLEDLARVQEKKLKLGIGGILFFGLPGCGKTYLASAFANTINRNFYKFTPADIVSMWLGNSQKNIKNIFAQARSKSPALLFIDELDSIAFKRDEREANTDQKASINQLLIELDNIEEKDVLVIGATNRLSALDTAIKRSGRFDLKLPIFPPNIIERKEIYEYYLMKLTTDLELNFKWDMIALDKISEESKGFTSSDIKLIVNKLRIEFLMGRVVNNKFVESLSKLITNFIKNGQRSLRENDVLDFIDECKQNDIQSSKIDFLKKEWSIK